MSLKKDLHPSKFAACIFEIGGPRCGEYGREFEIINSRSINEHQITGKGNLDFIDFGDWIYLDKENRITFRRAIFSFSVQFMKEQVCRSDNIEPCVFL